MPGFVCSKLCLSEALRGKFGLCLSIAFLNIFPPLAEIA